MTRRPESLDERLSARLEADRQAGLERRLPPVQAREGCHYTLDGHRVVGFCSNDYLGFASTPLTTPGRELPGSGASRLVSGEHPIYRKVEERLAQLVGQPDAVLFPSAFQLNVGALPALIEREHQVFSDRLNHASLIDGMRLARAQVTRLDHLQAPPPRAANDTHPRWWICESLYSMDGDGPQLSELRRAIDEGTWTYVDEAHAFGLYAQGGSRLSAAGLQPHAQVLAFGKALGIAGAAFAGTQTACQWIRTRARSFVFSTGLSPRLAEEIDASLDRLVSPEGEAARKRLWANRDLLASELDLPAPQAPIFPLVLGDPRRAVEISQRLLERGFHVQAIRPPTVPQGGSRLRLTLSAAHSTDEIKRLAAELRALLPQVQLSPSPARTLTTAKVS